MFVDFRNLNSHFRQRASGNMTLSALQMIIKALGQ